MLYSHTQEEWDDAFYSARRLLTNDNEKVEKLTNIYRDPSHFSGYYLVKVKGGSLGKHGDSHSEQNHGSVVAYLGQGGNLSIVEQVRALMKRHQNRLRNKTTQESSLAVSLELPYKTPFEEYEGRADCDARLVLSEYTYKKFFKKMLIKARNFQSHCTEENIVHVWPCNQISFHNTPPKEGQSFAVGDRCSCYYRFVYNVQCAHEFAVSKRFNCNLYDQRWYNWVYFCENINDMRKINFFDNVYENESDSNDMDFLSTFECQPVNSEDDNDNEDSNVFSAENSEKDKDDNDKNTTTEVSPTDSDLHQQQGNTEVTYSSLLSVCTELCRTIQNDKTELKKMYNSVSQAIKVYRRGGRVFFNMETDGAENNNKSLRAISTSINNANTMKRKMSAREQRIRKIQKKGYSSSQLSQEEDDDDEFLEAPNNKTKTCTLCRQPRHTLMSCDKLAGYRRPPLPKHDSQARSELVTNLLKKDYYKSNIINNIKDDDKVTKLPIGIKALILDEKCEYNMGNGQEKIFLRCTLLFEQGRSNLMYHKKLYSSEIIAHWLTKSKSNVVVNDIALNEEE